MSGVRRSARLQAKENVSEPADGSGVKSRLEEEKSPKTVVPRKRKAKKADLEKEPVNKEMVLEKAAEVAATAAAVEYREENKQPATESLRSTSSAPIRRKRKSSPTKETTESPVAESLPSTSSATNRRKRKSSQITSKEPSTQGEKEKKPAEKNAKKPKEKAREKAVPLLARPSRALPTPQLAFPAELYTDESERSSVKMRELSSLASLLTRGRLAVITDEECSHALANTSTDVQRAHTEDEQSSGSEEDEWEEMELADGEDSQAKDIEVDLGSKSAAGSSSYDWRTKWLRSEVNRRINEKQLNIHKALLLCLMCHMRRCSLAALHESLIPSLILSRLPPGYAALCGHPIDEITLGKLLRWFADAFRKSSADTPLERRVSGYRFPEQARYEKMTEANEFDTDEDRAVLLFAALVSLEQTARVCWHWQLEKRRKGIEGEGNGGERQEDGKAKGLKKNSEKMKKRRAELIHSWVELWNHTDQEWIIIDPRKGAVVEAAELEKALATPLHYVLAIDNKHGIRDVSFRYVSAFFTRAYAQRRPVDDWIKQTLRLKMFRADGQRSRLEDIEWQKRLRACDVPSTLSELKSHPLYVLEKDIKKYEGIYPPDAEPLSIVRNQKVFLRSQLHTLQGTLNWVKYGRVVKKGEVPYKEVSARPRPAKGSQPAPPPSSLSLYGFWQTVPYVPEPVVDGRIPCNEFGNVYVYRPEMVPPGAFHLRLPGLQSIAKSLNKQVVPALVGWQSQSGHNIPIIDGACVLKEDVIAFVAEFNRLQLERREKAEKDRQERILRLWRKLISGAMRLNRLHNRFGRDGQEEKKEGEVGEQLDDRTAAEMHGTWPRNLRPHSSN